MENFPPVLETERLILRPMRMTDAEDMFEYASDSETTECMLWDKHQSIDDTRGFLKTVLGAYEKKEAYDYAFELKDTGKLIGTGGFGTARLPHSTEFGYILNKKYWGRGLAPEAMKRLLDFLFDTLNCHRVSAKHFLENPKSGRVMQKLGMTLEGTFVDLLYVRGRYVTCPVYAIINPKHKI